MIKFLTLEQILKMHDAFIENFGGLPGVRDSNLLLSALEMPKTAFYGQEMYPTLYDKAAAYLFFIVCNHPFNDANKRTGFGAAYLFLRVNKVPIAFNDRALEDLVVEVAKGNKTKEQIAYFFEHGHEKIA